MYKEGVTDNVNPKIKDFVSPRSIFWPYAITCTQKSTKGELAQSIIQS